MATDELLWDLMLQEAAGGALEFDYLNDEQQANIIQDASDYSHTVPTIDSIENNCLFDDLFNFDGDANQSFKKTANSVNLADIFTEDVAELADGLMFTESFQLTDINPFSANEIPLTDQNEVKSEPSAAASSDHQYGTKDLEYVPAPIAIFSSSSLENISFSDISPELINCLLATISNLPESKYDKDSGSESCSVFAGDSAECSEDENMEEDDTSSVALPRTGGTSSSSRPRNADRKQRKMQQNRVAAYRYRQKKKAEQDSLRSERETLEKRNGLLKGRIQHMKQEIGYLRSLMTDMIKVRSSSH